MVSLVARLLFRFRCEGTENRAVGIVTGRVVEEGFKPPRWRTETDLRTYAVPEIERSTEVAWPLTGWEVNRIEQPVGIFRRSVGYCQFVQEMLDHVSERKRCRQRRQETRLAWAELWDRFCRVACH